MSYPLLMHISRQTTRIWTALALVAFAGALAVGTLLVDASVAGGQRSARKMSISVNKPGEVASGEEVIMRCKAKDQDGKPIRGATVAFRWHLPNGVCTHQATTNARGVAKNSHTPDCGSAEQYKAKVVVTARWHGQVRRITRYFTVTGGGT